MTATDEPIPARSRRPVWLVVVAAVVLLAAVIVVVRQVSAGSSPGTAASAPSASSGDPASPTDTPAPDTGTPDGATPPAAALSSPDLLPLEAPTPADSAAWEQECLALSATYASLLDTPDNRAAVCRHNPLTDPDSVEPGMFAEYASLHGVDAATAAVYGLWREKYQLYSDLIRLLAEPGGPADGRLAFTTVQWVPQFGLVVALTSGPPVPEIEALALASGRLVALTYSDLPLPAELRDWADENGPALRDLYPELGVVQVNDSALTISVPGNASPARAAQIEAEIAARTEQPPVPLGFAWSDDPLPSAGPLAAFAIPAGDDVPEPGFTAELVLDNGCIYLAGDGPDGDSSARTVVVMLTSSGQWDGERVVIRGTAVEFGEELLLGYLPNVTRPPDADSGYLPAGCDQDANYVWVH